MAPNEEQEKADLKIPGDHHSPPTPPPQKKPKKQKIKKNKQKQNKIRVMYKSKPTSNKCL